MVSVYVGKVVTLSCLSTTAPTWTKLQGGSAVDVEFDRSGNLYLLNELLIITYSETEHSGVYFCSVSQYNQTTVKRTFLVVVGGKFLILPSTSSITVMLELLQEY